jgi:uncharacterized protein YecE (DUF72 family)
MDRRPCPDDVSREQPETLERRDMPAGLYVGCAGWSLSSAVQPVFPREGSHLQRYAAVFSAVEINSAFYRPHLPATYARWRDSVPEAFRFSVKVPKAITHERRLRGAEDALEKFVGEVYHLGPKLGCLLLQLPPSLAFEAGSVETFLACLRGLTAVPVACEPRHPSWFGAAATGMLARFGMVYVDADPPVAALPPLSAPLCYLRLHGSPLMYRSSYADARLRRFAQMLVEARNAGQAAWCVFDNTADGAAVPDALALLALLR